MFKQCRLRHHPRNCRLFPLSPYPVSLIVTNTAQEMFIQYIASEGFTMAKLGKPRRNIQYKDLAAAVSHQDNLEFLEDIIPKTAPYKGMVVFRFH